MASSFFERINKGNKHTPDVLSCLANLSNDEVFTPPEVVNKMLDMLPNELFESRETTFLDPACKTGVFLREIAKRLLDNQLPLYQEKMELINEKKRMNIPLSVDDENFIKILNETIDHIFKKQLFGIAITELTSLLSRRSVYCSKYPNGPYSIAKFDNAEGNIRFRRVEHTWDKNGKCIYCGASKDTWEREKSLETHAYEFIHTVKPEGILNMKFDVIIGNPPYQLDDGGNGASAKPIYHKFVNQAKNLNPRYLSMIIPARWFAGGKGLDSFRDSMLNDRQITEIHDFVNASDCFIGVEIKGGVCYFLWENGKNGDCKVFSHKGDKIVSQMTRPLLENNSKTFIRYNEAIDILRKVQSKNEQTFDTIVSARKPFGLATNFKDYSMKKDVNNYIEIYAQKNKGYISNDKVSKNEEWISKWKIFIPKAVGSGNMETDILKPIIVGPDTVCSETYVVAGIYDSKSTAENVLSYIKTKFFHFMLGLKKITQDTTSKTYAFVPMQDFSKPWTDEELYEKYNLNDDEIAFIEKMIKPME